MTLLDTEVFNTTESHREHQLPTTCLGAALLGAALIAELEELDKLPTYEVAEAMAAQGARWGDVNTAPGPLRSWVLARVPGLHRFDVEIHGSDQTKSRIVELGISIEREGQPPLRSSNGVPETIAKIEWDWQNETGELNPFWPDSYEDDDRSVA